MKCSEDVTERKKEMKDLEIESTKEEFKVKLIRGVPDCAHLSFFNGNKCKHRPENCRIIIK